MTNKVVDFVLEVLIIVDIKHVNFPLVSGFTLNSQTHINVVILLCASLESDISVTQLGANLVEFWIMS